MRAVIVGVLALAVACGDGGGDAVDAGVDAFVPFCDGGVFKCSPESCSYWQQGSQIADDIALLDPAPLHTARTTRVAITVTLAWCEEPAMLRPEIDATNRVVHIPLRGFSRSEGCGVPRTIKRPVALVLPATGTWTIYAGADTTAPSLTVEVGPAPARPCGTDGACELDCDCDPGKRCLGGVGLVGPFTECARPCELDRDCGGVGRCETVEDGLAATCQGDTECDASHPCPVGWVCTTGRCEPEFQLGSGGRVACACDDDCAPGLRCVISRVTSEGRCEATCPTDGPWCAGPGAHACGRAEDDLAGLAAIDGVCGWLGE